MRTIKIGEEIKTDHGEIDFTLLADLSNSWQDSNTIMMFYWLLSMCLAA